MRTFRHFHGTNDLDSIPAHHEVHTSVGRLRVLEEYVPSSGWFSWVYLLGSDLGQRESFSSILIHSNRAARAQDTYELRHRDDGIYGWG